MQSQQDKQRLQRKMTKTTIQTILIVAACLMMCCAGCSKFQTNAERHYQSDISDINGHQCKWEHCPYKGVIDNKKAVTEYVGEEGTDAYYIDILHLENPTLEYDDLETLLFTTK